MNVPRSTLLLVISIICFVLAAVASEQGSDVIFAAVTWLGAGLALFAAAHIS